MSSLIYLYLHASFCVLVVLSNLVSGKLISLPLGLPGGIPAGVLIYPLTFLVSDLVTELYGSQKAKQMVYSALGLSLLSFGIIQFVLWLPASQTDNQVAFQLIMHSSSLALIASLIAYLIAQILDIKIYASIKQWSGPSFLWIRTNVSTLVSQLLDTIIVNFLHLYIGLGMDMSIVSQAIFFSYGYKAFFSIANTPFFYACVYYLGSRIDNSEKQLNFAI